MFAVTGDMILLPVFEARDALEAAGYRVRIVCVANPRRLYRAVRCRLAACRGAGRPCSWSDTDFDALFGGDALIGVSGGGTVGLEPVMLRSRCASRDLFGWQRGETTASPAEIMAFNGISADSLAGRARQLIHDANPPASDAA